VPGSSDHGDGSSLDILTKCDKCKKDCRKEDNPDPTCATKEWNFLKTHAPQFHFYNDIEASPGHFVYRTTSGSKRGSESGTKYYSASDHSPQHSPQTERTTSGSKRDSESVSKYYSASDHSPQHSPQHSPRHSPQTERTTSGSKRGSESGTKYNSFSEHSPPTEADLELLGLEEGFTESQLNGAWKKASLKYHPDKAGKSEEEQRMATEKMQEVNAAKVRLEPKAKHN